MENNMCVPRHLKKTQKDWKIRRLYVISYHLSYFRRMKHVFVGFQVFLHESTVD